MTTSRSRKIGTALAVVLAFSLGAVEQADARRGGGFGSRGMRTYSAPRPTPTAQQPAAPIQRSMTPQTPGQQPGARPAQPAAASQMAQQQQRGGFLRRWGGPILGGLLVGGLLGMLMGHGFGGAAGLLAMAVQIGLVALLIGAALWIFRRRGQPALAGAGANAPRSMYDRVDPQPINIQPESSRYEPTRFDAAPTGGSHGGNDNSDEIGLADGDFDAFERLLGDVQGAFGREDYGRLRELTTPEVMSYLAEELSANAVAGRRNDVSDVKLLQGDLSEAWREDDKDYATVAMRYSSIDVMRDRASGKVLEGDESRPTETTEIWTFVRDKQGPWGPSWRLSAIQDLDGN